MADRPGADRTFASDRSRSDAADARSRSDAVAGADLDGDGIPDALELSMVQQYLPYLSVHPNDACPLHGIVFRLRPHPLDSKLFAVWFDVLYNRDCGALGHAGDDETFGALINPKLPPPAGLVALKAISHQGGPCERTTSCGSLPGCSACVTAVRNGQAFPVVFASVNKHGNYVNKTTCDLNFACDFGGCALNLKPDSAPLVNAGEPGKPLVTNLTTQGFITPANGWTESSLLNYNPWGTADFGGAGKVAGDLVDNAFLINPGGC